MKKGDLLCSIFLVSLGIAIMIGSYYLKLGKIDKPGPGLMPFLCGIALSLLSILNILLKLRSFLYASRAHQKIRGIWNEINIKRVGLVLSYLVVYAIMLEKVGYILTTFMIFSFLFKTMGSLKLKTVLMLSSSCSILSYLIFAILLNVPLPKGILRII